jgi:hypothetical protein
LLNATNGLPFALIKVYTPQDNDANFLFLAELRQAMQSFIPPARPFTIGGGLTKAGIIYRPDFPPR